MMKMSFNDEKKYLLAQIENRKNSIEDYINKMISKLLTDLFEVEVVFKYCPNETFTVLPDILGIVISIHRSNYTFVQVLTPKYEATFYNDGNSQDGIFWTLQYYSEVGSSKKDYDITKKFIETYRKNYNEVGVCTMTVDYDTEEFIIYKDNNKGTMKFPDGIMTIWRIIMEYPYKNTGIKKLYERYMEYPIIEYQQLVLTFLMIRWFRDSVLSVMPKDVVRLIAKEIWALRLEKLDSVCQS